MYLKTAHMELIHVLYFIILYNPDLLLSCTYTLMCVQKGRSQAKKASITNSSYLNDNTNIFVKLIIKVQLRQC